MTDFEVINGKVRLTDALVADLASGKEPSTGQLAYLQALAAEVQRGRRAGTPWIEEIRERITALTLIGGLSNEIWSELCLVDGIMGQMIKQDNETRRADVERIKATVLEVLNEPGVPSWGEELAARCAERLAVPTVQLDDSELKQLRHHIADHQATCAYSCALIERLLTVQGSKP